MMDECLLIEQTAAANSNHDATETQNVTKNICDLYLSAPGMPNFPIK